MTKLSAIILTKNEEDNIADCVTSCLFADEILIIDDYSSDQTTAIARSLTPKVRVLQHQLDEDWSQQRNFALEQAGGDYILFVDADERVSTPLQEAIKKAIEKNKKSAYLLKRVNHFLSGSPRHGVFRPDWVLRLFPRKSGYYERPVHERFITNLPTKKLSGELIHHTYANWHEYWKKFDKYTELSAQTYAQENKSVHFLTDIVLRPIWAFFKIYFLNLGFVDGKLGFIFSVNHSIYTMTKYVKLLHLQKFSGRL